MTFGRISTYAIFQSTLKDASRVQSELFNLQTQLSSGQKAQNFEGISGQAEQFMELEAKISKTDLYVTSNKMVQSRIDTTSSVLGQIIDSGTNLKNIILSRRNNLQNDDGNFKEQLRGQWKALVGQLNTNTEGRYLFSGSRTDVPAVDGELFPQVAADGQPDDAYYTGSKQDVTVRVQDGVELIYNVRADHPGFQKIFAGLAMADDGDSTNDDSKLAQAYDLVQQGVQEVTSAQAKINADTVAIDQINERHNTLKVYWKGVKEDIGNTDIVSASTQVAINQGILTAAFQAFAKINSLRLSEFLR